MHPLLFYQGEANHIYAFYKLAVFIFNGVYTNIIQRNKQLSMSQHSVIVSLRYTFTWNGMPLAITMLAAHFKFSKVT